MKKRLLMILTLILMLTGCTANYTLKYEDEQFEEIVEITGEKEDDAHPTYDSIKENGLYADINSNEKFNLEDESSRFDVKLNHKLEKDSLKDLKAVTECFRLNTYKESENSYYMSLYGGFTCEYLKDSTFTLETKNIVATHNANEVDGDKYIWNLTKDAVDEEGINFQILKNSSKKSGLNDDKLIPIWLKILFAFLIIGSGVILIIILRKSIEK